MILYYVKWETRWHPALAKNVSTPKVFSIPEDEVKFEQNKRHLFKTPLKAMQAELRRKQDTIFKLHDKAEEIRETIKEQETELNRIVNILTDFEPEV
jgi:hypothetical protein